MKRPRRTQQPTDLPERSTDELYEVWMFGNLVDDHGNVVYYATPEQRAEAAALLTTLVEG